MSLLLVFVLLVTAHVFAADEFTIDPAHSSANFAVKHLMISTVHGSFSDVSGTIIYDEKDLSKSSVLAVIKTASVNTDNQTAIRIFGAPIFSRPTSTLRFDFRAPRSKRSAISFRLPAT